MVLNKGHEICVVVKRNIQQPRRSCELRKAANRHKRINPDRILSRPVALPGTCSSSRQVAQLRGDPAPAAAPGRPLLPNLRERRLLLHRLLPGLRRVLVRLLGGG